MESLLMSTLTTFAALTAVLGLAWLSLRLLRGRLGGNSADAAEHAHAPLRVVRSLSLGARERVVLVEHAGERWLLGVTAGGISTVAHWPGTAGGADAKHSEEPEFGRGAAATGSGQASAG
jgi:flagellar protein FliO/FliZ